LYYLDRRGLEKGKLLKAEEGARILVNSHPGDNLSLLAKSNGGTPTPGKRG